MNAEIVIIGAGPAGTAAAIQLKRAGKNIALLEAHQVGGLLRQASLLENIPGFPNGITGSEYCHQLEQHLNKLEIRPLQQTAKDISWNGNYFTIKTNSQKITAPYLIVATGTIPKIPAFEIPPALNSYVHSEIDNLTKLTNQHIAIVGAGDAAFDYVLNLAPKNKITLLCRSQPRCLDLLYTRARSYSEIEIINNISLKNIRPAKNGLEISCIKGNEACTIIADHLLLAIGRRANKDFLNRAFNATEIVQLTKAKRLFLVGDLKNGLLRQATIAAGEGMRAAMEIIGDCFAPQGARNDINENNCH